VPWSPGQALSDLDHVAAVTRRAEDRMTRRSARQERSIHRVPDRGSGGRWCLEAGRGYQAVGLSRAVPLLHAMHVSFGRQTFQPRPPEALGVGVMWAFAGERAPLSLYGPSGEVDAGSIPGMQTWLRKINQFAEFRMLAGPADEEIEDLRRYGYRPETTVETSRSRLEW
jgi:hypothetical protein